MSQKIYCVDTSQSVTPEMVRDATVECFIQAHSEVLDSMKEYHEFKSEEEFEDMKKLDVKLLIETKFKELNADFNHPTKEDIINVINKLAEYAANFRKPEIVKKHYDEILTLVNKL